MGRSPSLGGEAPPPLAPALREALGRRCRPDGFLPFDRFMEVALYAPGVGYYQRPRTPFGPEGDFYTAPRVHPMYARTVAAHVAKRRSELAATEPFFLVDLGSGDGRLLAGVSGALGERHLAEGFRCVAIDRSPARRAASLAAVEATARATGPRPLAAASLSELGPVRGVVLAHELLDAQPARRLRWNGTAWVELGFRLGEGGLAPAEAPQIAPVPPPSLPVLGPDEAGRILEVAPAAEGLIREVADHLEQGWLVIVDFGAEESELLARHPHGTLAGVRGHRSLPEPTAAPGEADLSTFVNFSRIRRAASAAGLTEVAFCSQAEALGAWGFSGELDRALGESRSPEEEVRVRLAAKNLLFGFTRFRVLELAAGVPARTPGRASAPWPAAPP